FQKFNKGYDKTSGVYKSLLLRIAGRRGITLLLLGGFFLATWGAAAILPSSFIPTEDQGMLYVNVTTPPGATVERTQTILTAIEKIAKQNKAVENVTTLAGYSLVNEIAGASYGMVMINLKPWDERDEDVH